MEVKMTRIKTVVFVLLALSMVFVGCASKQEPEPKELQSLEFPDHVFSGNH